MLDSESHQIREVFAYYGRAMYCGQVLEKAIGVMLSSVYAPTSPEQMSKYRYDDLRQEHLNSKKTLGVLLSIFRQRAQPQDISAIEDKLTIALEKRNWLAHSYWWDRALEFNTPDGRESMLSELEETTLLFEKITESLEQITSLFLYSKGIDLEAEMESLLKSGYVPPLPSTRKLNKQERLVQVYKYHSKLGDKVIETPLFELEDHTYWTLCDVGLTYGPTSVDQSSIAALPEIQRLLPCNISPRPKDAANWNYNIELKDGYYIWVTLANQVEGFAFRWGIKHH